MIQDVLVNIILGENSFRLLNSEIGNDRLEVFHSFIDKVLFSSP